MKNTTLATVVVLIFLLSGCGSTPQVEVESDSPNEAACHDFQDLTIAVIQTAAKDSVADLIDIDVKFDNIALQADGEVRTRILKLIDDLPDSPELLLVSDNHQAFYSDNVEAVG